MKHLVIRILTSIIALAGFSFSQSVQLLFVIERSKNANKVYYEARIGKDGALDSKKPVHVYWIEWAKDSSGNTRKELSPIEKKLAYGYKMKKKSNGKSVIMNIAAFPQRTMRIYLKDGKAVCEVDIGGSASFLDKIYIHSVETKMLPKVNYVELFGRSVETGEAHYEKIIPK